MDKNGNSQGIDADLTEISHVPVLSTEVIQWLRCRSGGQYLDCTLGQGGLAQRILEASEPEGFLVGIDQDEEALAVARERLKPYEARTQLILGNFRDLKHYVGTLGLDGVDGVVFDLGVSSAQLGNPERGFSFMTEGPLDMRMDRRSEVTAADLVNRLSERDLADLIFRYGEERYARRIARAVVRARAKRMLRTTTELVAVIREAVPASYHHGRLHYATRTFQALRIAVNRELEILEGAVRDAAELLLPGGRLCVISFHSLEDRIVKQTIHALSRGPEPWLASLTKKPIMASEQERTTNPRARSAKLRVAERLPQGRCA